MLYKISKSAVLLSKIVLLFFLFALGNIINLPYIFTSRNNFKVFVFICYNEFKILLAMLAEIWTTH
jgi:hypothetical protein